MTIMAISADGVGHEFPDGTDPALIGGKMRDYAVSQLSLMGDAAGGLHDLGTAVGQGLGVAGGLMSRNGMPDWGGDVSSAGQWVQNHSPDAPAGPAPSDQLATAIKNGDWHNVPSLLAHSAVRGAPSALPVIGAGLAGGPVAAGATAAALAEGPTAYARAANNGRSEPTTADDAEAVPGALVSGVGGMLAPGASKFASPLGRAAFRAASEGAGGVISNAGAQLGGSVGTDNGAQFDPAQAAGAGLTQGAIGAARGVPNVGRAALGGTADAVMSRVAVPGPTSDAEAQSQARIGAMYRQAQASDPNATPQQTLNNLKTQVVVTANQTARSLFNARLLSPDLYNTAKRVINDQAQRHNNTIGDASSNVLLDDLMNSGVPQPLLDPLISGIHDLNTLAPTSFLKNQTGPFRAIGTGLGSVAGALGTLGIASHPLAKVAGAIGGVADNIAGTATPKALLQAQAANRYLQARNLLAGPNSIDAMQGAQQAASNYQAPQAPTPPGPVPSFIRPRPPVPTPAPAPGFVRPNVAPPTPAPAPGFIRPNVAPPTPAPAPGFVRPNVAPPTPAPAPGFIRPSVAAPEPTAPDQSDPQQASIAISNMRRIQAQARALMAQQSNEGQPDPATGLPSSPIPPNTPIRASTPTPPAAPSVPSLPPLRIDTAETVRNALDTADRQLAPNAPAALPNKGGLRFLAQSGPGLTPEDGLKMVQAAEQAGHVPKGTAELAAVGVPIDRPLLDAVVAHSKSSAQSPGDSGVVRNPLAYAHTLRQEGNAYSSVVNAAPDLRHIADMMRSPEANGKTKAGREAVMNGYLSTIADPAARARAAAVLSPLTGYGQD